MKKLNLALDELTVESLPTVQPAAENTEVEAFSPQTGCRNCPTPP